ncbi:MAG: autotransporter-associated beta strand repeat-containing protein, partial [Planctomycetales bacterium]|nr:autotransporter-associated beta strand repeat-containing protein [Planctomycetales bacterium]
NAFIVASNGPLGTGDAQGYLTTHLDYQDDNAVSARASALGAATFDNGNFAMLWQTEFTPDATGVWGFRFNNVDDNASLWIDDDQNNVFEQTADRFYDRGCCGGSGDQFTVSLTAGQTYDLGFVMNDTGGGGYFRDAEYLSPAGGGWQNVDPSASSLFNVVVTPDNNITKTGAGTTTFSGANTYGGTTTISEGTLVAANNSALGVADGTAATGTSVANGATLALSGGVDIGNEAIVLGSSVGGPAATLRSSGGANSTSGNVTLAGNGVIDSQAGSSLTINGSIDMGGGAGGRLSVQGAGETTINGAISGNLATQFIAQTPGLIGGILNCNPDTTTPNPGNLGVSLTLNGLFRDAGPNDALREAAWGATKANGGGNGPGNATLVYTGQIFLPGGDVTFVEHNDDVSRLTIDGSLILNNNQWDVATAGTINRAAGWYDFEARFSNGGGGYGFFGTGNQGNGGWAGQEGGFGMALGIPGNTLPGSYTLMPTDPGDATLFRTGAATIVDANDLHFFGDGILRLNGDNTYAGKTSVGDTNGGFGTPSATSGTLIVNGTTSGQGSYYISSGATLGGNGTIGLAAGETVFISNSPGIVSPGDAGFGYMGPDPTYSMGLDPATVGTLSFVGATDTDLVLDLSGGIYQVDLVDPSTVDMINALNGQIDVSGALLRINDQVDIGSLDLESLGFALGSGVSLFLVKADDGILGDFANAGAFTGLDASGKFDVELIHSSNAIFLQLSAVPEPAGIAIWSLLGLAGEVYAGRRMRRRA